MVDVFMELEILVHFQARFSLLIGPIYHMFVLNLHQHDLSCYIERGVHLETLPKMGKIYVLGFCYFPFGMAKTSYCHGIGDHLFHFSYVSLPLVRGLLLLFNGNNLLRFDVVIDQLDALRICYRKSLSMSLQKAP